MKKFKDLIERIKKTEHFEEKCRFIKFVLLVLFAIFLSFFLFKKAFASYQSYSKLNSNIDKALYVLEAGALSFNIDQEQIIPSDTPYIYKFTISNFNASKHSDVDLNYHLSLTTTTNLPLTYKLYRNQNHDDPSATNLLSVSESKQDEDGAWYNVFSPTEDYTFEYTEKKTDTYTLVIIFPKSYKSNTLYADNIDNIELKIESSQIIGG